MTNEPRSKIFIDMHPPLTAADAKMHTIEKKRINFDEQTRALLRTKKQSESLPVNFQSPPMPPLPQAIIEDMGLDELLTKIDKNHVQMRTLEQNIKQNEVKMAKLNQELNKLKQKLK